MSISPWVVGQTHPTWKLTWTDDEKNPVDLTGATVTLWIFTRAGTSVAGAGTISVPVPTSGVVYYSPALADSPVPGSFWIALKAVYPDGSVLWQQPAKQWTITLLP